MQLGRLLATEWGLSVQALLKLANKNLPIELGRFDKVKTTVFCFEELKRDYDATSCA